MPVATASLVDGTGPHEAVWLPLNGDGGRLRLAALADVPRPAESEERAAAGGLRAWRFDRLRPEADEDVPGPGTKRPDWATMTKREETTP